jgi:DNA repair photolyase
MQFTKESTVGRGAKMNTPNTFSAQKYEQEMYEEEDFARKKTQFLEENSRDIVNFTKSEDLNGMIYVNPYQGCEHGCIYCFARNSHEYWGYSAGVDFETKIMVKRNAPELLEKKFLSKAWKAETIHLSGNTDCYQPAEKKYGITRRILEVCLKYRNPVAILTKNSLILRDLDLLKALNELKLVKVMLSITTVNEELRRAMEPRTATAEKRFRTLRTLSEAGIPTGVMTAPIIPGLNDHEIPEIIKEAAAAGAQFSSYTVVRLNGAVGPLFEDWILDAFPDKAAKVMHQIAECHGGQVNDSRFGVRIKGEGKFAEHIKNLHQLSVRRYIGEKDLPKLERHHFTRGGQLSLF